MTKGFTLIELLAVIVRLAIIATITTVVVISVINNQQKNGAELSTQGVIDSAKNYMANNVLLENGVFNNGQLKYISFPTAEFSNDGDTPINGEISINPNGDIKIIELLEINGYYCGYNSDSKIECSKNENDVVAKEPTSIVTFIATNNGVTLTDINVSIKNNLNESVPSNNNGTVSLIEGTYSYEVSKFGYSKNTGSLTITSDDILNCNKTINLVFNTCQDLNNCTYYDVIFLNDNSAWIIMNTDFATNSKTTLLSAYNLKNSDGIFTATTGKTTSNTTGTWSQDSIDNKFGAVNSVAYDNGTNRFLSGSYCINGYGCNVYASFDSATPSLVVPGDSLLKKYNDAYLNQLKVSSVVSNTTIIRPLSLNEVCNVINTVNSVSNFSLTTYGYLSSKYPTYTIPMWLYSSSYWLSTPYSGNHTQEWTINSNGYVGYAFCSYAYENYGIRPVIEIEKSFIM